MNSDKLVIGMKGKDDIRELLTKKGVGETVTFEVTVTIDEITPDQAVFSVDSAEMESEEAAPENEQEGDEEMGESAGMGMMGKSSGPPPAMAVFGGAKP